MPRRWRFERYLVIPGVVWSRNDGDRHYISADRLMQLYGVNPRDCLIAGPGVRGEGLTELRPREDGDYRLPKEAR